MAEVLKVPQGLGRFRDVPGFRTSLFAVIPPLKSVTTNRMLKFFFPPFPSSLNHKIGRARGGGGCTKLKPTKSVECLWPAKEEVRALMIFK